jgi:polyhydroxyalkanoate synthesis regulator phasin
LTFITHCVIFIDTMSQRLREIVRYRNRKLYEKSERRFVTLDDIARSVAHGDRIRVIAADTGDDITARILSRALASDRVSIPASSDAIALLLRAGSDAAQTVAGVAERVGAARMADAVRLAAQPERIAETFAPMTRRFETARNDVERIVAGLVGRGRLSWEEGARLREDVGAVFRESFSDVVGRVRDLVGRLSPGASPAVHSEIQELARRLDHLEQLASASFPKNVSTPSSPRTNGRPSPARKKEKRTP